MPQKKLFSGNIKFFFLSFIFSSLSIFFAYWIYPSASSILAISFLVISLTPLFYNIIENEETIVAHSMRKIGFLERHKTIISVYLMIAFGTFLSLSLWYNVLPTDPEFSETGHCSTFLPCKEEIFKLQMLSVDEKSVNLTEGFFLMGLCFLLALFFGTGALLILLWDESLFVVTFAISSPLHFLIYLPKFFAFGFMGLSGALLSVAVVRHEWGSHSFLIVLKDSIRLLFLSVVLFLSYYFLSGLF